MKTIQLTRGHVVMVDDEDYPVLAAHKWQAKPGRRTVYAQRFQWLPSEERTLTIYMARVIMGLPRTRTKDDRRVVDHIDGNGLNNCRSNLRICESNQDNIRAQHVRSTPSKSSRYKGVSLEKQSKRWVAQITYGGRPHRIGRFRSELDAALAYNAAAQEKFGEFACLNNFAS